MRSMEEYSFQVKLTSKDYYSLLQYAERMDATAEELLQAFISDLAGNSKNKESTRRADSWYKQVQFTKSLEQSLGKAPTKIVRFTDGTMCAAHGSIKEIIKEIKTRFPEKEIERIV